MNYIFRLVVIFTLYFFTAVCLAIEQPAIMVKHSDTLGISSEQPFDVLVTQDQSGDDDNWDKYQEYYSVLAGYHGQFSFTLPSTMTRESVSKLVLEINFRGPKYHEQPWRWALWDNKRSKWVTIGTNRQAPNWRWIMLKFDAPGEAKDFIAQNGSIKMRYASPGNDASAMDYLALKVTGDSNTGGDNTGEGNTNGEPSDWWRPGLGVTWQYQLTGLIDTSVNADIFVIDLFDTPQSAIDELHALGRRVICEFNAGLWEEWRDDAGRYPESILGAPRDGWPGERWVDFRQMDIVGPILLDRLEVAVAKKCDGVEPDNLDSIVNNTGLPLTANDQLIFNRWLAEQAHQRGMAVMLKNDLVQIPDLVDYFDIALNEECFEFNECDMLLPFINAGKPVVSVEYKGDMDTLCSGAASLGFNLIVKKLGLDAWREVCP